MTDPWQRIVGPWRGRSPGPSQVIGADDPDYFLFLSDERHQSLLLFNQPHKPLLLRDHVSDLLCDHADQIISQWGK
jgi:hypothetical protein